MQEPFKSAREDKEKEKEDKAAEERGSWQKQSKEVRTSSIPRVGKGVCPGCQIRSEQ